MTTQPQMLRGQRFTVQCLSTEGFHTVSYRLWGPEHASADVTTVICCHGLTRNCRDFDYLASALIECKTKPGKPRSELGAPYRVVCVDVVGRGESDWLANKALYGYQQYLNDMATVIARVTAGQPEEQGVVWIGTSMGGIIGMMLSAQPRTPIKKLVMNDVGAQVPKEGIQRIATYVGVECVFKTFDEAIQDVRTRYGPVFGPTMKEEHVLHYAKHGLYPVYEDSDGKHWPAASLTPPTLAQTEQFEAQHRKVVGYKLRYDTGISVNFKAGPMDKDVDMWSFWDKISAPVLLLHGEESDVLTTAIAKKMAEKSGVTLIDFPHTGHVPPLISDVDIPRVVSWVQDH